MYNTFKRKIVYVLWERQSCHTPALEFPGPPPDGRWHHYVKDRRALILQYNLQTHTHILQVSTLTTAPLRKYNIYITPTFFRFPWQIGLRKWIALCFYGSWSLHSNKYMGVPGLPRSKGTNTLVSWKLYWRICPYLPGQCAFWGIFYIKDKTHILPAW
jgi:hypothetical protein